MGMFLVEISESSAQSRQGKELAPELAEKSFPLKLLVLCPLPASHTQTHYACRERVMRRGRACCGGTGTCWFPTAALAFTKIMS